MTARSGGGAKDKRGKTSETVRTTRRGLLALAGATAVAGCSGLPDFPADQTQTIRAYDLPDIDEDTDFTPVIPQALPVAISSNYFQRLQDRVTTLLSRLPTPFGPQHVPNGYIRRELLEAAADASNGLSEAWGARTGLVALQSLRRAREQGRFAAAGWEMADGGLTPENLQRERHRAVGDARELREHYEYRGADPIRAAVVHAELRSTLEWTIRDEVRVDGNGELLTVASWGEEAESARASVSNVRHLLDQYTASLPSDAGSLAPTLTRTARSLFEELRSRRSSLAPEPTAGEYGVAEWVVADLRREALRGPDGLEEAIGPATRVVEAHRRLTHVRALGQVQERIESGDVSRAPSAEAVREVRQAAYDEFEMVLQRSPAPDLTRTAVTNAGWRVVNADRELSRARGRVSPASLDDVVADYIIGAAVARAAPWAAQQVLAAIGST